MSLFQAPNNPSAALSQHLLRSRPIAVHRHVLAIAGSPAAGVLLSQLVYWTRRGIGVAEQQGWIHKTAEQWARETGMSWKVQQRARKALISRGLIEERTSGMPRRTEYRLNLNVFASRTSELIQIQLQDDFVSLDLFRTDDIVIKQLLGNAVSYHRVLAELTPHINDALLLSRLIHDQRQAGRWMVRSRSDWLRELCMSRDEWETARRHLRTLGVLVERQSNFPRRVNLLVDQAALVRALNKNAQGQFVKAQPMSRRSADKTSGVPPRSASVAEKPVDPTVGGIGRFCTAGFPTSESPNPAYPNPTHPNPASKACPKPPAQIAQSRLYMERGGLQDPLQQDGLPPVVGVVDEGRGLEFGLEGVARPGPPSQNPPIPPSQAPAVGASPDHLVWPDFLNEEQRPGVWWHLSHVAARAQDVLDEVAWTHAKSVVRNPVGLVRHLVGLVAQGTFIAEGAPEIQRRRKAAADIAARMDHRACLDTTPEALTFASGDTPQPVATEASLKARDLIREHLERVRRTRPPSGPGRSV